MTETTFQLLYGSSSTYTAIYLLRLRFNTSYLDSLIHIVVCYLFIDCVCSSGCIPAVWHFIEQMDGVCCKYDHLQVFTVTHVSQLQLPRTKYRSNPSLKLVDFNCLTATVTKRGLGLQEVMHYVYEPYINSTRGGRYLGKLIMGEQRTNFIESATLHDPICTDPIHTKGSLRYSTNIASTKQLERRPAHCARCRPQSQSILPPFFRLYNHTM